MNGDAIAGWILAALLFGGAYFWHIHEVAKPHMASIEKQRVCAEQARQEHRDGGYNESSVISYSSYTDHYNSKMKRCFMLLNTTTIVTSSMSVNSTLSDAMEHQGFGNYLVNDGHLTFCEITPPTKPRVECHSLAEWNKLIQPYMENALASGG